MQSLSYTDIANLTMKERLAIKNRKCDSKINYLGEECAVSIHSGYHTSAKIARIFNKESQKYNEEYLHKAKMEEYHHLAIWKSIMINNYKINQNQLYKISLIPKTIGYIFGFIMGFSDKTIDIAEYSIESEITIHYENQIISIEDSHNQFVKECMNDEISHRDKAEEAIKNFFSGTITDLIRLLIKCGLSFFKT